MKHVQAPKPHIPEHRSHIPHFSLGRAIWLDEVRKLVANRFHTNAATKLRPASLQPGSHPSQDAINLIAQNRLKCGMLCKCYGTWRKGAERRLIQHACRCPCKETETTN